MRATAAKAAIFSQYRSPVPFFGLPSSPAPAPASGGIATGVPPPLISLPSGDNGRRQVEAGAAAKLRSWDAMDWEFPAWKNEVDDAAAAADLMSPAMRFLFGPVPTLAEAKAATSDLKVALDKVNFSSSIGRGPNIVERSSIVPPMPSRPVVQAFSLLQESPEAQDSADNSIRRSVLADIMKIMKNNARGMVSNVSNFLQDFFVASETYLHSYHEGFKFALRCHRDIIDIYRAGDIGDFGGAREERHCVKR